MNAITEQIVQSDSINLRKMISFIIMKSLTTVIFWTPPHI